MKENESFEILIGREHLTVSGATLEKYNRPGPRYTSYPTAPEWTDDRDGARWREALKRPRAATDLAPMSLYFHIPFCQSLCLYCGCNVFISKNHDVSRPYLDHLKREITWVSEELDRARRVEQLHWGGGTPTYLSPAEIEDLYGHISERFTFAPDAEISVEIDPRATSVEQLQVMRRLGFNRVSLGIQDFDPVVQKTIRRVQPFEMTKDLFDYCRELGFESINVDLIYGLPHQTVESFRDSIAKIIFLNPDRIALFSYAHVPWMKKQQGSFARFLPESAEKFRILVRAIEEFTDGGYRYIGLDHFARPDDEICRAQDERTLHRNFQGYTTKAGCDLFGMGVSAISATRDAYAQNWRELPSYYEAIDGARWPVMRGVQLTEEDRLRRSVINRILCHCLVEKDEIESEFGIGFDEHFANELDRLLDLERDGLVSLFDDRIEVRALGRIFIRNIAMQFDAYLNRPEVEHKQVFSKTL